MTASRIVRVTAAFLWFVLCPAHYDFLFAAASNLAPSGLQVFDTPNDGGGSLTVVWAPSGADQPDAQYQVLLGEAGAADPGGLKVIAEFPANSRYVKESKGAWWTRAADRTWHQYVIRNGKGVQLKEGTVYSVTVAMRRGDDRAFGPLL